MKGLIGIGLIAILCSASVQAKDCSKLIVSSDPDYPPISWRDPRQPERIIGVAIEIVERALAEKDVQVESRYMGPWKRVLRNTGQIDLISGLYISDERKAFWDFIQPAFMSDPNVVFVRKGGGFAFAKWQDLQGRKGAVRLGDSFGNEFDAFAKNYLQIEQIPMFEQLFGMLEAGRIDYFLCGLNTCLALAEEFGFDQRLDYLPTPISEEGVYIAFSKNSACSGYAEHLRQKIVQYVNEGLPQELSEKYRKLWEAQQEMDKRPGS